MFIYISSEICIGLLRGSNFNYISNLGVINILALCNVAYLDAEPKAHKKVCELSLRYAFIC